MQIVIQYQSHLCVRVNLKTRNRGVQSRNLGYIIVLPLPLFFLELEGDAANRTLLDTLHEMGCETGDFVAQTLRRNYGLN